MPRVDPDSKILEFLDVTFFLSAGEGFPHLLSYKWTVYFLTLAPLLMFLHFQKYLAQNFGLIRHIHILSNFRSAVNLGSDLFLRFSRAVMSFYFVFIMK